MINICILICGIPPLVYLLNTHLPVKKYAKLKSEKELNNFNDLNNLDNYNDLNEHEGLSYRSNYKERLISSEFNNGDEETKIK